MNTIDRINDLLALKGISAAQMSRDLGFSNGLYSQWKSGLQKPSAKKLEKIAEYFDVTVDYLLGHTDEKNAPIVTTEGELWDRLNQLSDPELDELETFLDYLLYKRSHS